MTTVNTYLTFTGNCREAFEFYKSVFGGEFNYIGTFGEMPTQEGMPPVLDKDKEKLMHISLPISEQTVLMGSDSLEGFGLKIIQGNNFSISISTQSKDEADRLFKALSVGGQVTMALNETFWGAYFGMLKDKFGINWMVNVELDVPS